ncbi:MAG TPA: class I SAM-dependent methyltransferase [Bryobacteraceae bacterium]
MTSISPWLRAILRCPADGSELADAENRLLCPHGHEFGVVEGVPVMLTENQDETLWVRSASLAAAREVGHGNRAPDELFLDTIGCTPEILARLSASLADLDALPAGVDPVASSLVLATNGLLYKGLTGRLTRIPIPAISLPEGGGRILLDVGCSWGRWSIAGARRGYRAIGLDPSLGAVLAAKRLAERCAVQAAFVVGDATALPFSNRAFDAAFSYSVLQHFGSQALDQSLREMRRVLREDGRMLVQMANALGVRSLYHQARRRFAEGQLFDVRYRTPGELLATFNRIFGDVSLAADCFLGLGVQSSDRDLLPLRNRLIVDLSEALKKLSVRIPWMRYCADSVYLSHPQ